MRLGEPLTNSQKGAPTLAKDKPGIRERFRLARKVFSQGLPWARYGGGGQAKKAPFVWPAWRENKPEWHITDYEAYCTEGFAQNSLIYAALMYKARAGITAPLKAYKPGEKRPVEVDVSHPLAVLLKRPNPYQSGAEFHQLNIIYQNLDGNVYILLDREKKGAFPVAMRSLRPDRVWIVPMQGGLKGYLYVPEGKTPSTARNADVVPILPEDMIHIRLPNPYDPLEGMGYGLPSLSSVAWSADIDNDITKFLKMFFQTGTMLNTILSFDVELDDEEIVRIQERWREKYGGVENWGEVGVLDKTGKVTHLGMTFKDMGFDALDERNESRILGPLGVPPILLGTRIGLQRSTMSNYAEARQHFWQDTFLPDLNLFEVEFQNRLTMEDGTYPAYDLSRVPALQRDIPKLAEAAYKLWTMGVPANDAVDAVGLPVENIPGGDQGYISFTVVQVGQKPDASQQRQLVGNPSKARAEQKDLVLTDEAKATVWKIADLTAQSWEARFAAAALTAFAEDEGQILARIHTQEGKARERKATVDWEETQKAIEEYLKEQSQIIWRSAFIPLLQGVMATQGQYWAAKLGVQFSVENLYASTWFEEYTLKFAQPITATTSDNLSALLQEASRGGWSMDVVKSRISQFFRQYMYGDVPSEDLAWFKDRLPEFRREMIARTETMRALNAGTYELFKEWGVDSHEWLTIMDGRERLTHGAVNGQVRKVGEMFDVGGWKMRYPHDPAAPAGEVVNCRCTLVPVIKKSAE